LVSAETILQDAAEWILRSASAEHMVLFHLSRARLLIDQKNLDAADSELVSGINLATRSEIGLVRIDLLNERARLLLERDDPSLLDEAMKTCRLALDGDETVTLPEPASFVEIDPEFVKKHFPARDLTSALTVSRGTFNEAASERFDLSAAYDEPILDHDLIAIETSGNRRVRIVNLRTASASDNAVVGALTPGCNYAWGAARSFHLLGMAYLKGGNRTGADDAWSKAEERYRRLQSPDADVVNELRRSIA
jgi:hypothetical protein